MSNRARFAAFALSCVAVLAVAAVAMVWLLTRKPPEAAQSSDFPAYTRAPVPVVDEENFARIDEEITERVEQGMFETYMTTTWRFPDGESAASEAVMGNSVNNTYDFWFEVVIKETKEPVYTSSLLPVGTAVKEIKLTKDLPKGTYPAVVQIHMIDENGEDLAGNAAAFNISLVVES